MKRSTPISTLLKRDLRKAREFAMSKWFDAKGRERQHLAGVVEGLDFAHARISKRFPRMPRSY